MRHRLLTRVVLYRRPNVGRFDLDGFWKQNRLGVRCWRCQKGHRLSGRGKTIIYSANHLSGIIRWPTNSRSTNDLSERPSKCSGRSGTAMRRGRLSEDQGKLGNCDMPLTQTTSHGGSSGSTRITGPESGCIEPGSSSISTIYFVAPSLKSRAL